MLGAVRTIGQVSMSQSEFFWDQSLNCDDDGGHCRGYVSLHHNSLEWMWDMAWTARLRRIHFTDPSQAESNAGRSNLGALAGRVGEWIGMVFAH